MPVMTVCDIWIRAWRPLLWKAINRTRGVGRRIPGKVVSFLLALLFNKNAMNGLVPVVMYDTFRVCAQTRKSKTGKIKKMCSLAS